MRSVGVVVVTHNSAHLVKNCLSPLTDAGFSVVVVDNRSEDQTSRIVAEEFPDVTLLQNDTNAGFARAVNRGARSLDVDHIMLLNPDAVIEPDAVVALSRIVDDRPDWIVAPRIEDPSGVHRVVGAGRFPTPWAMLTHYLGLSRGARVLPRLAGHYLTADQLAGETDPVEVEWVTGACVMMSAELWQRLGGLSTRWFMYAEDIELCWRAADVNGGRRAARCVVVPTIRATHLVGQSSTSIGDARDKPLRPSDWVRNLYDFYCTSMALSRLNCILWGIATAFGLGVRATVFLAQSVPGGPGGRRRRRQAFEFARHAIAIGVLAPTATRRGVR
ncbi:MAG: glycosyltransferase family 2 protein [Gordonia polyisoprenivorans]|nr:glycosyltransferase family 2 protein [Gordonia polyisoprenivorans]